MAQRRRRPLRFVEVEATSRCTRCCAVCARSVLAGQWHGGDLSAATWERLAGGLEHAEHVLFRGWGEPLLHPDLAAMVGDARAAGCAVTVFSNGDLLEDAAEWLVAAGVAVAVVTVAGGVTRHASLHGGAPVAGVWRSVHQLAAARGRRRLPRLQVQYVLTADNARDLPGAIDEARRAGADEVRVSHLDCTPTFGLFEEAAFATGGLAPATVEELGVAWSVARAAGICYHPPPRGGESVVTCARNPLLSLFVAWDGRVGPCPHLMLPVDGEIPRCDALGAVTVEPMSFGSLTDAGLGAILAGEGRGSFVDAFARRVAADRHRGAQPDWVAEGLHGLPPLPRGCTSCHKAAGW